MSTTNVRLARQLNRFSNVNFRQGLLEEVDRMFPPGSFDLIYSFAFLEHVRDVDATLAAMLTVLPTGRAPLRAALSVLEPHRRCPV